MFCQRERANDNKNHGFTLIELMIVVVIVGILMAIAFPSYRAWILKSHRSDAMASLAQNQAILERCYAQNFTYNGTCGSLPSFPQNSPQGYYIITLTNQTATTYTLTATATDTQALDTTCETFSVDQSNLKTATQAACWTP